MTASTRSPHVYALEDCESLLLNQRDLTADGSQIVVDIELFEALINIARQARRWGA